MDKKPFPLSIECKDVVLKKHNLDVATTMFSYVEKDRSRLREFLPWVDATKSVQDEINYITMTHEKWEKFELFDYGIFNTKMGIYMGNIGAHTIAWADNRCELGYWILGDFEGKGLMSDAVLGLEKTCFEMGFNRVEIRCSSLNQRSASVPRRLGYRLEGVLAQDVIESGRYRDTLIFGKTKSQKKTGELPALLGLNHVYLFVENVCKSAEWYEQALGVAPLERQENFVLFQLGQSELCLHPADGKSPVSTGGSVGYWRTPKIKSAVQLFEKYGASVYRGPIEIGPGQSICQIKDPFGNVFGLVGSTK